MKIITACVDLYNMSGLTYNLDRYGRGKFESINKTLQNSATHINKPFATKCTICGHKDGDGKFDNRVLVEFWKCNVCKNYNPMLHNHENGVYECPCGNEFNTN